MSERRGLRFLFLILGLAGTGGTILVLVGAMPPGSGNDGTAVFPIALAAGVAGLAYHRPTRAATEQENTHDR